MSGWALHRRTLTVLQTTTGTADVDGVPTTTEVPRQWTGCQVQPLSTSEQTGGMERVTETWLVSGDLATWVSSGDRVVVDGVPRRVQGQPKHFTTLLPHTEAVLVAWKGA